MRVALPFDPLWHPDDPDRGCYSCGRVPDGRYHDGSPSYRCVHEPVRSPPGWTPTASERRTGKNIPITLTPEEIEEADGYGRARQAASKHLNPTHGLKADESESEHLNILGCRGEKVVSKFLGIPWDRPLWRHKRGGDVGPYQVRTPRRRHYSLILRPDDDDRDIYILVVPTDAIPVLIVVGWIVCGDGRRPEWLRAHVGREAAWFVPQSVLKPFPVP